MHIPCTTIPSTVKSWPKSRLARSSASTCLCTVEVHQQTYIRRRARSLFKEGAVVRTRIRKGPTFGCTQWMLIWAP